jgi:hypothetical protein
MIGDREKAREAASSSLARDEATWAFGISLILFLVGLCLRSQRSIENVADVCAFAAAITMAWVATYRGLTLWIGKRTPLWRPVAHLAFALMLTYHIVKDLL